MPVLRVSLLALVLALLTQTACGKKGQLYLPDNPRPTAADAAKAAPATLPEDDGPSLPSAPAAP